MNNLTQKWLTALRSNQYQQTRGRLRDETGFCCLGVLCDIYDNSKWINRGGIQHYRVYGNNGFPPDEVYKATTLSPVFLYGLADLNDSGDCDFSQIADYIERHHIHPADHPALDTAPVPETGAEPEPAA